MSGFIRTILRDSTAVAVALASAHAQAAVVETTGSWSGMAVTIVSPAEKITFGTPFDVSFRMDSRTVPPNADLLAFGATVSFSPTVDLSNALWRYDFSSDFPGSSTTRAGALGDLFAPVSGSYVVSLRDPVWFDPFINFDGFSFLDSSFNDVLVWSFTNLVIGGDTTVGLRIDDGGIVGVADFSSSVIVIDPPAQVTAPPALLLTLAGLGALAGSRRWRSYSQ